MVTGISIILATNMLTNGFLLVIENFSESQNLSNLDYEIRVKDNNINLFNSDQMKKIDNLLKKAESIDYYFKKLIQPVSINIDNVDFGEYQLVVSNVTKLMELHHIIITNIIDLNFPLINKNLDFSLNGNITNYTFQSKLFSIKSDTTMEFISLNSYYYDSIIDFRSELIPTLYKNSWNSIIVKFLKDKDNEFIISEINKIENVEIVTLRSDTLFLVKTANQIQDILNLLQIGFSALLIISITNIITTLISESEKDILVMKMVGLTSKSIILLFIGQVFIIGILSFLFSIFLSYVILNIILSLLASTSIFPFIKVQTENSAFLVVLVQSLVISFLSSLYPSWKVSQK